MLENADREAAARAAGRGVLWIAAAKAWFMVAGWAIEFALPHLLTAALFGVWKVVVGAVSVVNNTIVTGTIQAVSKFTSERDADAGVARAALRVQALVGGAVAGGFFLAAPLVARFERDASLTPYLRATAAITFCYALYAVFVGSANGLRRFHVQAGLDMSFSTIKAGLVIGAAAAGLGVGGAIGGFVLASALILGIAAVAVGARRATEPFPARRIALFMSQILAYTLLLNLLLLLDLFLVRRFAGEVATADEASRQAAYYAAAQTLARIPYQGILAVAFVIFPLVSRSTFAQDRDATRAYVAQTMRFSLLFCASLAVVFAANPAAMLGVPYPAEYVAGAPALAVLAIGQVFFSIFAIAATILNGAGRTGVALALVAGTLVASGGLCVLGARAGSADLLPSAAAGVALGTALGGIASLVALARTLGATLPLQTALRVMVAFAATVALGRAVPDGGKLRALLEAALCQATFLGILALMGELSRADLARVRRILARGQGGG